MSNILARVVWWVLVNFGGNEGTVTAGVFNPRQDLLQQNNMCEHAGTTVSPIVSFCLVSILLFNIVMSCLNKLPTMFGTK